MGDRREQHEAGDALRMIESVGRGQNTRPRMGDQDGAAGADARERLMNEFRLARGRGVGAAAGPVAPAVAGPVDEDHAIVRGQPVGQRQAHVFEIGARAVQQHDRRRVGWAKLHQVKPAAFDLDETARGRMGALDLVDPDSRENGKRAEKRRHHRKDREGHAQKTGHVRCSKNGFPLTAGGRSSLAYDSNIRC